MKVLKAIAEAVGNFHFQTLQAISYTFSDFLVARPCFRLQDIDVTEPCVIGQCNHTRFKSFRLQAIDACMALGQRRCRER